MVEGASYTTRTTTSFIPTTISFLSIFPELTSMPLHECLDDQQYLYSLLASPLKSIHIEGINEFDISSRKRVATPHVSQFLVSTIYLYLLVQVQISQVQILVIVNSMSLSQGNFASQRFFWDEDSVQFLGVEILCQICITQGQYLSQGVQHIAALKV